MVVHKYNHLLISKHAKYVFIFFRAIKLCTYLFFYFEITPICYILQAEAQRREVEVRKMGEDLVEIRRKNRVIQDKVKEQIDVLQRKLEEYKIEHKAQEESLEDEIVAKEDLITSVKQSIEVRMKAIELDTSETKLSEEERYKKYRVSKMKNVFYVKVISFGIVQFGNFSIFLSPKFYVKSILENLEVV